ncbi:hypothetical protein [Yoonia sp. I 8.24]|uniref:hypothetical protein n=1 Tax=Yoonia sp. I 8.24 TaxID=1537229 RepID=UPI001EE01388|nr:hypothetical protein [Yoonia sp. I 8.24]MCG3268599.1 hypothetical protein [Yoonia sp. I 8.24]
MLFKLSYRRNAGKLTVTIEGKLTVKHPSLKLPHGIDFVDEHTLAVANRKGRLVVLRLPDVPFDGNEATADLLYESDKASWRHDMKSPGSVAVANKGRFGYQVLVCLNYSKRIAHQKIFTGFGDHRAYRRRIALKRGMEILDGISVCSQSKSVAISNHDEHAIRVYPSYRSISKHVEPSGRLMGSAYPHGVRFMQDGRGVLVADAGAPLVHYWRDDTTNWQGDHQPTGSFKIMDDATFLAGRHNTQEGGPKGLDIHPFGDFLVLTSEQQGFAAYDLTTMMAQVRS